MEKTLYMKHKCNCCDEIYNSFDVHFTSACDNKCAHCVRLFGLEVRKNDCKCLLKRDSKTMGRH